MMYSLDLTKGYSMPIVAQAIENYFLKNKPVMDLSLIHIQMCIRDRVIGIMIDTETELHKKNKDSEAS